MITLVSSNCVPKSGHIWHPFNTQIVPILFSSICYQNSILLLLPKGYARTVNATDDLYTDGLPTASLYALRKVLLYVDLHGHSKKSNIFMYGVQNPTDEGLYMRERIIPTLLDRTSPLFNLEDCTFDVRRLVGSVSLYIRALIGWLSLMS